MFHSEQKESEYRIMGLVDHFGEMGYGHYTATGNNGNDEDKNWWYFDDDNVEKIMDVMEEPFFNEQEGSSEVYIVGLELNI